MAAFTAHEFTTPPDTEQVTYLQGSAKFDTNANFNGQAGIPYNGNFTVTALNEIPQGVLFTALYAQVAVNTITVQFTAPLQSASTTTSDYTLTGTSAPSITSVVFNNGSREILLNLSGPLSSVNTYTLAIGRNKVLSGSQIAYYQNKDGAPNYSSLVVDVILPAEIDTIGVGIEQDITLGTPNVNTAGASVAVGIEQDITLGTPVASTLVAETGVGIEQDILLGTPVTGLFDTCTGVGFVQTITVGTPVADINPLTPTGVGIAQNIILGTPVAAGSGNVHGVGIQQNILLGTPVAVLVNNKIMDGVGIEQDIVLGTPDVAQTISPTDVFMRGVGIEVDITLGTPVSNIQHFGLVITPEQAALVALLDPMIQAAFLEGVSGGNPNLLPPVTKYDTLTTLQQKQCRTPFENVFCAFITALSIPDAFPTTNDSDSTTIAKLTGGGTEGSLSFVDGILVTKVDPT
jgi:hypothetical protein